MLVFYVPNPPGTSVCKPTFRLSLFTSKIAGRPYKITNSLPRS